MPKYVQIIEFETDKIDEVTKLDEEWRKATEGKRTAEHVLVCEDRDKAGRYVIIVEFPSADAAEKNNALPETQKFAEAQMKLAKGPAKFTNLDVVREDNG